MKRLFPAWVGAPRLDPVLLVLLMLIIGFGLVVLYSASGQNMAMVNRQAARLGFGLVVMLVISQAPPRILRLWTPWLYGLGIAMLLATWMLGVGRGTQRWLDLGLLRFQPSEIMKLAIPMIIGWYFQTRVLPPGWRDSLVVVVMIVVPAFLIYRQPDLGTAILIIVSGFITLFLAGLRWSYLAGLAATATVATPIAWYFMHEYQRSRIRTFLYPESDRGQTKLKSKALKNKNEFMQAARNLEDETAKLAASAKTGDLNAVKAQFGAAAKTCKGCHSEFKSK